MKNQIEELEQRLEMGAWLGGEGGKGGDGKTDGGKGGDGGDGGITVEVKK